MNQNLTRFTLLILISAFFSLNVFAQESWTVSKKAEDITVYVKKADQSAIKTFKGEMLVKSRLTPLVALLKDTPNFPKLLHDCKMAKTLKTVSDIESYQYIVTAMPWPVKDRDFIVHTILKQDPQNKQVSITANAVPTFLKQKSGLVRIKNMRVRWVITPLKNENVKVVYEVSVDPAGNIPKWLVNTLAVDVPFNTLKNLRTQLKNKKYQAAMLNYINE